MATEPDGEGLMVTTTDALHDAWKGELEVHYNKEEILVRVSWSR